MLNNSKHCLVFHLHELLPMLLRHRCGRYVYEGEAILGDYEYEFEIDANSGVIIDWEKEWYDEWDD